MKIRNDQNGMAAAEALLILVALIVVGFIGWFVYHSQQTANTVIRTTDQTSQSGANGTKVIAVDSFASCKKEPGSNILQSSPPQCVSKAGKTFTAPTAKTLVIKEWGVELPYTSGATFSYHLDTDSFASLISSDLVEAYGCTSDGAGAITRGLGTDIADRTYDSKGNPETIAQVAAQYPNAYKKVGDYYYVYGFDQAACADKPTAASGDAQKAAEAFMNTLVPKQLTAVK